MRLEIVGEDDHPFIATLWEILSHYSGPGEVHFWMSSDLGPNGNERGLVVLIVGREGGTVVLQCPKTKEVFNPSLRQR